MIVKEFIKKLQQFDENSLIVIDGYEGGVTSEYAIIKSKIVKNLHKEWYYGESEIDTEGDIEVVYISRKMLIEDRGI